MLIEKMILWQMDPSYERLTVKEFQGTNCQIYEQKQINSKEIKRVITGSENH